MRRSAFIHSSEKIFLTLEAFETYEPEPLLHLGSYGSYAHYSTYGGALQHFHQPLEDRLMIRDRASALDVEPESPIPAPHSPLRERTELSPRWS